MKNKSQSTSSISRGWKPLPHIHHRTVGAASSRDRNKMNNDNMKEKDKCGQEIIY
jgi:hypothetical protein